VHNFETTLEDCREGNAQAWEALVRFYQGRVFAVSYYYLKNREDAVDVAQDSFIKVYGQLDSFDGDGDSFYPGCLPSLEIALSTEFAKPIPGAAMRKNLNIAHQKKMSLPTLRTSFTRDSPYHCYIVLWKSLTP